MTKTGNTSQARSLRRSETDAEHKLWLRLRDRRLGGHKFVRQLPVGPYFADFVCREASLIIELDGSQHAGSQYDIGRDAFLNERGFAVLRFWNPEVFTAIDAVCETIMAAIEGRLEPFERYSGPSSALRAPSPRKRGEGDARHLGDAQAERCPSPLRGEGVQRTDEGTHSPSPTQGISP